MDLYNETSYQLSKRLTLRYSTSFGMSSRLFPKNIRPHIYAIYGLVRIADEIVDAYEGFDRAELLDELERHTEAAMKNGYSPNPIVHAFALTARRYNITNDLTRPFFASMRMDLLPKLYDRNLYIQYIYGSAEVVGLMCLRVFTCNNLELYEELRVGAKALGAAYQKVNFLRDVRDDYGKLGRVYFPGVDYASFDNEQKRKIEKDIDNDFSTALPAIQNLPKSAKRAVLMSYDYYLALFKKIKSSDANTIKNGRLRISNIYKLMLLMKRLLS